MNSTKKISPEEKERTLNDLSVIQRELFFEDWTPNPERVNAKYLEKHPELEEKFKYLLPEVYENLVAIKVNDEVIEAQKKYENRKIPYLLFFSLLWWAIYDKWWAVIWFLIWYLIWNYFQPNKVVDRIITKSEKSK